MKHTCNRSTQELEEHTSRLAVPLSQKRCREQGQGDDSAGRALAALAGDLGSNLSTTSPSSKPPVIPIIDLKSSAGLGNACTRYTETYRVCTCKRACTQTYMHKNKLFNGGELTQETLGCCFPNSVFETEFPQPRLTRTSHPPAPPKYWNYKLVPPHPT